MTEEPSWTWCSLFLTVLKLVEWHVGHDQETHEDDGQNDHRVEPIDRPETNKRSDKVDAETDVRPLLKSFWDSWDNQDQGTDHLEDGEHDAEVGRVAKLANPLFGQFGVRGQGWHHPFK